MKTIKVILVCLSFGLLAGCVIREDRGGADYDRDRGEVHHHERGGDRERGGDYDRDRSDDQRRFN